MAVCGAGKYLYVKMVMDFIVDYFGASSKIGGGDNRKDPPKVPKN